MISIYVNLYDFSGDKKNYIIIDKNNRDNMRVYAVI